MGIDYPFSLPALTALSCQPSLRRQFTPMAIWRETRFTDPGANRSIWRFTVSSLPPNARGSNFEPRPST